MNLVNNLYDKFLQFKYFWRPTSPTLLENAELKIFASVQGIVTFSYVTIEALKAQLRTMKIITHQNDKITTPYPMVLLHGMGAGIGLWCKNIDALSANRNLYGIDLLGFGRSTRYIFPNNLKEVENIYVQSIEEWREKVGLDKFILLGHSMGGYLAFIYACKYPERIRHLILADPWGISEYNIEMLQKRKTSTNMLVKIFTSFSPLFIIRAAGPFGPSLLKKIRPDLGFYFYGDNQNLMVNEKVLQEDNLGLYDYIYHCNAQSPSGELAFNTLSRELGWAGSPIITRVNELDSKIPITFLYGEESWMDVKAAIVIHDKRSHSYVDVKIIPSCGHHIYAEGSEYFNKTVNEICYCVDLSQDVAGSILLNKDSIKQNIRYRNKFHNKNLNNDDDNKKQ